MTAVNAAQVILGPALARGLGDAPAIIFEGRAITYAELDDRSSRCGHVFRDARVAAQDRVMLLVHDRPEWFYAYLGAMKIGAVPVAINLRCSADELAFVIEDSGCRVLVLDAAFLELYRSVEARLPAPPEVIVADRAVAGHRHLGRLMADRPDRLAPVELAADDMALWMYTSGTTGKPKAAVHMARAMPAAPGFLDKVLGVGPGDRLFCASKLFFAFSLGHCFLASLQLGAATILFEGWPSAAAVAEVVARDRPTVMFTVPTLYRNLLAGGHAEDRAFRRVRHYVAAGERLPETLFERWRAATGRPLLEGVGATEALMLFLANRPDDCRPGASGRPVPDTEVRLVDDAGRTITEAGRAGVMWVRSPCVAAGYWNQDAKTAAAFRDGWYCTGDVFAGDGDGWYRHLGRHDDMLKISGQWVSPAEIEAAVLENARVEEAAVVGVADADGLTRLALFLVVADGVQRAALETEIMATLTARLSVYKCPRRFFYVDQMPRTATGKLRRFVLRDQAAAGDA